MTTEKGLTMLGESNTVARMEQLTQESPGPMGIVDEKRRIQLRLLKSDAAKISRLVAEVDGSVSDFCSGMIDYCIDSLGVFYSEIVEDIADHGGWKRVLSSPENKWEFYAQAFVDPETDAKLEALSMCLNTPKGKLASFLVHGVLSERSGESLYEYAHYWWPQHAKLWEKPSSQEQAD